MLTAFTAGLLLITVSELGDKTFFITAILAMRHPHRPVLIGSVAALSVMTVLSVLLGQVAMLLPRVYVQWAEAILFLGFGLKLIYEAQQMSDQPAVAEQAEALEAITQAEAKLPQKRGELAIILETFGLVFIGEWGDRTQIATIALAAANSPVGVAVGAILGHTLCAVLAVACGRLLCGRISERAMARLGGCLFLVFAAVGFYELR